ncbi:MAG: hypothetical protein U0X73_05785 [Thermoanaerobaculia bacterium]
MKWRTSTRRLGPGSALALALLALGCASLPSPADPELAREVVPLRDRCAYLMTPSLVARFRELAPRAVAAATERERRAVFAPLARRFWWRLLRVERYRTVLTLDVMIPSYVENAEGVVDASDDYRFLRLVDSSSGRHDPRRWENVDTEFENVWIHQANYPAAASYPQDRPPLLLQCWAGRLRAAQDAPALEVTFHGSPVGLDAQRAARLGADLDELAGRCSIVARATPPASGALVVSRRWSAPRAFALSPPATGSVAADRLLLVADPQADEGWPRLYALGAEGSVGLAKCDGGKLLDTVCTPELEPLLPEPARESCPLAPRRRASEPKAIP